MEEIRKRHNTAARFALNSVAVGAFAGIFVTAYRYLIPLIGKEVEVVFSWGRSNPLQGLVVILMMTAAGVGAAFMVRREPMIGGSGIPQVSGEMHGYFDLCWWRILLYKFLGGLLTLGGGLTMGREGPSVQIGASVAEGYCKLTKRTKSEERYLIASGAAAGLAAAFNAPISGLVFALEEVHRTFSPLAMISAMAAALTANYVSVFVFGVSPVLKLPKLPPMNVKIYWILILLGVIMGLSGVLFNFLIVRGKRLYAKLPVPAFVKPVIPFVLTGIAVLMHPGLFGSGEHYIFLPIEGNDSLEKLIFLYFVKLALLLLAFCSGLPGGIFFPLLILGSLAGNIVGSVCADLGLIHPDWVLIFSVIAMSAHFASIVRSPVTGILLMVEMTASFSYLLPLGLVTLIAYLTAELCRSEPVYESLLSFLIRGKGDGVMPERVAEVTHSESLSREMEHLADKPSGRPDLMVEFAVNPSSKADGKLIRELKIPENVLLISVKRGNTEILPRGHVRLHSGDYLVGLLHHDNLKETEKAMEALLRERG